MVFGYKEASLIARNWRAKCSFILNIRSPTAHPSRSVQVEFRAKAVGTESNPDAPVYVQTVGIVAPTAEVEVELTLPAGAYTVQAKASHWLRGEVMGLGTRPLLKVYPGNQRVLLWWGERGNTFRVYKGTSPEQMQQIASVDGGYFIDTNVTNSTAYYYKVERVVNGQWSTTQVVTPSAYIWFVLPNPSQLATVTTEDLQVELASAAGVVPECTLMLDDAESVGSVPPTPFAPSLTTTPVWFSTIEWRVGIHYLILRDAGNAARDFLVIDFQPQRFSEFACDKDAISPGESVTIRFRYHGSETWTVTVSYPEDEQDVVVRQWSGTGTEPVQIAWDGRDVLGNAVEDGTYFVTLYSGAIGRTTATIYSGSSPRRPSMFAVVAGDWRTKAEMDFEYAKYLRKKFHFMRQLGLMWPYRVDVMKKEGSSALSSLLNDVLTAAPLRLFYFYGHGSFGTRCGSSQRIPALELYMTPFCTYAAWLPACSPPRVFSVENLFATNQFNWALRFVWIDTCWSSGSTNDHDDKNAPAEYSDAWTSRAFPPNDADRFVMGWQGPAYLNRRDDPATLVREDGWYEWRKRFWTNLAAGGTFWQAINYANSMPQAFYYGWGVATPNRRIRYDGNSYQTIYD